MLYTKEVCTFPIAISPKLNLQRAGIQGVRTLKIPVRFSLRVLYIDTVCPPMLMCVPFLVHLISLSDANEQAG
jgi:hypothetical protein